MRLATPLKLGKRKKAAMAEGEGRGGGAGNKTTGIREKCVKGKRKKGVSYLREREDKKKLIYIL